MSYIPEVGEVCEVSPEATTAYLEGVILYIDNSDVIYKLGNDKKLFKPLRSLKFRKLKTERERFIEEGEVVLSNMYSAKFLTQGEIILALYNSGKFKLVESGDE